MVPSEQGMGKDVGHYEDCCIKFEVCIVFCFFFFQAEDGIRDLTVTGVQTCALPIFIRLDEIQPGKSKSFEEARADLEAQLRRDRATDRFGEVQEQLQAKMAEPGADLDRKSVV